jgi:DNA-binding transcriptional regulator LsrR (DeoR family)
VDRARYLAGYKDLRNTNGGQMMENELTADRIVAAAQDLGQTEFTRPDLAAKLGVSNKELRDAFKAARQAGHIERVGKDAEDRGVFRLAQR